MNKSADAVRKAGREEIEIVPYDLSCLIHSSGRQIVSGVIAKGSYVYFWRATFGGDIPPWYAFFIKRNDCRVRTHHIHMITRHRAFTEHWERLLFRDYLMPNSETAQQYEHLKIELAKRHPLDRAAYTAAKASFIERIMVQARKRQ